MIISIRVSFRLWTVVEAVLQTEIYIFSISSNISEQGRRLVSEV